MVQYIGLILPGITLLFAFLGGSKANRFDVFFRYILCYIIATEILGIIIPLCTNISNNFVYNLYSLIIFILFISLFYLNTVSVKWKKLMELFSVLLILVFLADNLINRNFFSEMQYLTYLPGAVILIITISGYLYEIIDTDRIIYFYKLRSFWVSMGLLLFYIPFVPILIGMKSHLLDFDVRLILIISLNIIMHICFIISYLWAENI